MEPDRKQSTRNIGGYKYYYFASIFWQRTMNFLDLFIFFSLSMTGSSRWLSLRDFFHGSKIAYVFFITSQEGSHTTREEQLCCKPGWVTC